jgi:hypothetical protein
MIYRIDWAISNHVNHVNPVQLVSAGILLWLLRSLLRVALRFVMTLKIIEQRMFA